VELSWRAPSSPPVGCRRGEVLWPLGALSVSRCAHGSPGADPSAWVAQDPSPGFQRRAGDRRGQRQITARQSSPLWYGLGFLILLAVAQLYYLSPGGKSIPYSEFKSLLKSGQVAEVSIAEQLIRGTLRQDIVGTDSKPTK